jgi:hypothetical protein
LKKQAQKHNVLWMPVEQILVPAGAFDHETSLLKCPSAPDVGGVATRRDFT